MHYCPYCGVKLEENAKFCPNCGKRLSMFDRSKPSDALIAKTGSDTTPSSDNPTAHSSLNQVQQARQHTNKILNFWVSLCITVIVSYGTGLGFIGAFFCGLIINSVVAVIVNSFRREQQAKENEKRSIK
ncbi:zinc-ribbon domain-containing protein [Schleiferilactobacillus perolens]|uniref:zinc-ribbon domain-containing protein n=1 Tax=Schleiferilactobacillus perolens TaxID=100468 RepID=UPI0007095D0A|nr:zinc ribbon domain-containing protein [Schleiferilactobacillus perolens]